MSVVAEVLDYVMSTLAYSGIGGVVGFGAGWFVRGAVAAKREIDEVHNAVFGETPVGPHDTGMRRRRSDWPRPRPGRSSREERHDD